MADRQLSTGDARRREAVRAAIPAFALRGYYGTSTTDIAQRASISQAYLYRLYPNKQALFVAVLSEVKDRMRIAIEEAAADGTTDLQVIAARTRLDHDTAMVLIHASAAVDEPHIRDAVADCYRDQVEFLTDRFGATPSDIRMFIATSQLVSQVQSLHPGDGDEWAATLLG